MSKVRIEYMRLGDERNDYARGSIVKVHPSAVTIEVSSSATVAASRPVVPAVEVGHATTVVRLTALDGFVSVSWGADPTAAPGSGILLVPCTPQSISVTVGQLLSFIAAGISGGQAVSVSDTTGGSAVALPAGKAHAASSVPVTLATEDTGSAITAAAMPAGGVGLFGWLSAIWYKLTTGIAVTPQMASGGNLAAVSTSTVTGTTYTAFAAQACKQLTLCCIDADVEFQQGGAGGAFGVSAGAPFTIFGISDASQIAVRRKDGLTTAVTVYGRWEA